MAKELSVLSVAAEAYPLVKTGGLADVVGALPAALRAEGVAMRTLLPGYPAVMDAMRDAVAGARDSRRCMAAPARVLPGQRAAASTCWCSMLRISTRVPAARMADRQANGRTTACASPRLPRRGGGDRAWRSQRLFVPDVCRRTTGMRD